MYCAIEEVLIRGMTTSDLHAVQEIEAASFKYPHTAEEFRRVLAREDAFGKIAEQDGTVIGFVLVLVTEDHLYIFDVAVCRHFRGRGVGRKLLRSVLSGLQDRRLQRAALHVHRADEIAVCVVGVSGNGCRDGCVPGWRRRAVHGVSRGVFAPALEGRAGKAILRSSPRAPCA